MKRSLNIQYSCIHASYWMFFGVISSFASVFLLAQGYSNSEIGIILAVSNILAVVLQPITADFADRTKKISAIQITSIITVFMMVLTAGLFIFKGKTAAVAVIFILLIAWHTVLQPIFNSLTFKLNDYGANINFGVARSMGSLAYSALVAVLGTLVEVRGISVLPLTGELTLLILLFSLIITERKYNKMKEKSYASNINIPLTNQQEDDDINIIEFIKKHKSFFIINIGVIGIFFSNSILNNYMMQIVSDVGGSSEDMGRILSLMAFLEIPTMLCFNFLLRKFSCKFMLQIASVGFTLKIFFCFIATSVSMIFAAQFLQLVSFALFLPAMVQFTGEIMRRGEAIKGQALFTTMITVTTVFSSLVGGVILDISGAKALTLTATILTAAGTALIIPAVNSIEYTAD